MACRCLRPFGDSGWAVGAYWHAAIVGGQVKGQHGVALAEGKSFPWESFKPFMQGCESCMPGGQTQASEKLPPD